MNSCLDLGVLSPKASIGRRERLVETLQVPIDLRIACVHGAIDGRIVQDRGGVLPESSLTVSL